jgi:hypothetical protein
LENGSLKQVPEDFRLPVCPLVVIFGNLGDHVLEGGIARLVVDPLDALG